MNKKQWLILGMLGACNFVVCSLLAILAILDLPFPGAETPTPAPPIAQSGYNGPEAETVRQFVGDTGLQFEEHGVEAYPFGQTRRLMTTGAGYGAIYEVDTSTNEVRLMFRRDQRAETVNISQEQARATAMDFARTHYPDFDTLNLTLVTEELVAPEGQSDKFYTFQWVRFDPDSEAVLPFMVRIRVNAATGEIASYSNLRQEVTMSTQPQIEKAQAREIALEAVAADPSQAQIGEVQLAVDRLPLDTGYSDQMLVWQVVVEILNDEEYQPGAMVYVNAQDGAVERIEPFLGAIQVETDNPPFPGNTNPPISADQIAPRRIDLYAAITRNMFNEPDQGITDSADQVVYATHNRLAPYLDQLEGCDCLEIQRHMHDATAETALNHLPNDIIFLAVGHAQPEYIDFQSEEYETRLESTTDQGIADHFYLGGLEPGSLSQLRLAIFMGCHSGWGYPRPGLLDTAVEKGARAVVGFRGSLLMFQMDEWSDRFWWYLLDAGGSVQDAAAWADGSLFNFLYPPRSVVAGPDIDRPLNLSSVCSTTPQPDTASVSVDPELACPGQTLYQNGTGFVPGQPVELTFTHQRTGQTWSYTIPAENVLDDGTGNGNYIHEFTMATDFPAGRYHYTAYQPASGRESNTAQYWLSNPEVANPGVGWPGATLDESGTGFGPGEDVELVFTYPDGNQHTAQETTDEQGAYQHNYPVPASDEVLPGWYTYSARGLASGCSSAPVRFWITDPQVAVSQDDYVCQISGTGFTPGEQIDIQMVRESVLASGEADNRTLNDTTGANDAGEFTYQARLDLAGKTYDSLRFIVTDSRSGLTMASETTCELVELHGLEDLPTEGLVAYYPFNGNANDESGSGNDGIVEGATPTADRFGHPNSAYAFNGQTDYIASNSDVSFENSYSVSLWFNYSQQKSKFGNVFYHGRAERCLYEPRIQVSDKGKLHTLVSGCDRSGHFGSAEIEPGIWHHVMVVVQGKSQKLYLNGERVATGSKSRSNHSAKIFMGVMSMDGSSSHNKGFFNGAIDDVRVYNRALTEEEVQALHHEGDWEPEPISSEELEVPFSGGPNAVTTQNSYSGRVLITVSGTGRAAGKQLSDAFYLFTDEQGNTTAPRHPTDRYNWLLWINGAHAERFIVGGQVPAYREDHVYTFEIEAPGGLLTFGIGDVGGRDNQGSYQVRVQRIP